MVCRRKMLGSFTEELVNRTIEWYGSDGVAFFRKSHVAISFSNPRRSPIEKGDVDYYGVHEGRYIAFEVKETSRDYFQLSQLKRHQREILLELDRYGATSFLLLNFASRDNTVILIGAKKLGELFGAGRGRITYEEALEMGIRAPIVFPGVIDWLECLGLRK